MADNVPLVFLISKRRVPTTLYNSLSTSILHALESHILYHPLLPFPNGFFQFCFLIFQSSIYNYELHVLTPRGFSFPNFHRISLLFFFHYHRFFRISSTRFLPYISIPKAFGCNKSKKYSGRCGTERSCQSAKQSPFVYRRANSL